MQVFLTKFGEYDESASDTIIHEEQSVSDVSQNVVGQFSGIIEQYRHDIESKAASTDGEIITENASPEIVSKEIESKEIDHPHSYSDK